MNSIIYNANKANFNFSANLKVIREGGYNILNDNGQIKEPNITEKKLDLYFINTNQIYQKIINKGIITENDIP